MVNSWFETPRFPVGTEQRITKRTTEKGKYVLWLVDKAHALLAVKLFKVKMNVNWADSALAGEDQFYELRKCHPAHTLRAGKAVCSAWGSLVTYSSVDTFFLAEGCHW